MTSRIIGTLITLTGFVLVANPELLTQSTVPDDTFEAIERRIRWGLLIGVGLFIFFYDHLKPWPDNLLVAAASVTVGVLSSRLVGLVLDGFASEQLFWVGFELILLAVFLFWHQKRRASSEGTQ